MNSDYPNSIDNFQTKKNRLGTTFDPTNDEIFFAEDANKIADAIVKIEETLGIEVQGGESTVADRLLAIENALPKYTGTSGTFGYGATFQLRKFGQVVVFTMYTTPTSNMPATGTTSVIIPAAYRPNFKTGGVMRNGGNGGSKPVEVFVNTNGTVGWWAAEAINKSTIALNMTWIRSS